MKKPQKHKRYRLLWRYAMARFKKTDILLRRALTKLYGGTYEEWLQYPEDIRKEGYRLLAVSTFVNEHLLYAPVMLKRINAFCDDAIIFVNKMLGGDDNVRKY